MKLKNKSTKFRNFSKLIRIETTKTKQQIASGEASNSCRLITFEPVSTDTEKDRVKQEKDRIGVTYGWMCHPYLMEELPWDLHQFFRS